MDRIKNYYILFIAAFLYVIICVCPLWGITTDGKMRFNEIWSGDICLTGDVLVPRYVTLTIEKGTHITFSTGTVQSDFKVLRMISDEEINLAFDGKISIIVKGNIKAEGGVGKGEHIIIGDDNKDIHWGAFVFLGHNKDSILRNVIIQGAVVGAIFADNSSCQINKVKFQNNGMGAMCLDRSTPALVESEISESMTSGIDILGKSAPIIKLNNIDSNLGAGINIKDSSKPKIKGNSISNNQIGMAIYDKAHPRIEEENKLRFNKQDFLGLVSPVTWQNKPTYGNIRKDEIWEGKINITGDVVVPVGVTLTILPGTEISFTSNHSEFDAKVIREVSGKKRNIAFSNKCDIIVYGTLKVNGQIHRNVKIGVSQDRNYGGDRISWGSIIFLGHNADSTVNYADIRNASIGLFFWDDATPKITNCKINNNEFGIVCVDMSSPLISNNTINLNKFGIGVYDFASPRIIKNVIREVSGLGVGSKDVAIPKLLENKIFSNEVGIGVYDSSSPTIDGNFISNNRLGLLTFDHSKPQIVNNIIERNRDVGIRIKDSSNPTIDNNQFRENNDGIEFWVTAKPQFGTNIFQKNRKRIVTKSGKRKVTTSGILRGNETWSGNIYLTGDVVIPKGIVLEILPGTIITFSPNASDYEFIEMKDIDDKQINIAFNGRCDIIVKGRIVAIGSDDKKILIGNPELRGYVKEKVGWGSIIFVGNSRSCMLENVLVRFASLGISLWDLSSPIIKDITIEKSTVGIDCFGESSPVIDHSTIAENRFGIINEGRSSAKIRRNIITNNHIGISCKGRTDCKIENNLISKNKYGIDIGSRSEPLIVKNTISGGGVGVSCSDFSAPRIEKNRIDENRTGIMIENASLPKISGNSFDSDWQKIIDLRQSKLGFDLNAN